MVSSKTILLLKLILFHFVSDSNMNPSCTFINLHSGNGTGRHHFHTIRRITAKNGMADQAAQSGSTFPAVLHNFHRHRIGKGRDKENTFVRISDNNSRSSIKSPPFDIMIQQKYCFMLSMSDFCCFSRFAGNSLSCPLQQIKRFWFMFFT